MGKELGRRNSGGEGKDFGELGKWGNHRRGFRVFEDTPTLFFNVAEGETRHWYVTDILIDTIRLFLGT